LFENLVNEFPLIFFQQIDRILSDDFFELHITVSNKDTIFALIKGHVHGIKADSVDILFDRQHLFDLYQILVRYFVIDSFDEHIDMLSFVVIELPIYQHNYTT